MDATRPRALALLSGGLDSSLAVRVLLEQGVPVTALHFVSVFSGGRTADGRLRARAVADELGVPLVVRDATPAMLEFVPKPRFGWGRHLNPCIDCHSFQISVAKGMLEETGASFVVTGEVLGQRPMSQNRESLGRVAKASGMNGLLLRPLSALKLDPTTPEEKGWVDRSRLLGIGGRSRQEQNALAEKWRLEEYGAPAGGCLLTDPQFAWKLQDLLNWDYSEGEPLRANDVHLLKVGRHFRFESGARAVVGRNGAENAKVLTLARPGDWVLVAAAGSSPETLLRSGAAKSAGDLEAAARLTARFSKHRRADKVEVVARPVRAGPGGNGVWEASAGEERRLTVAPAGDELVRSRAVRRPDS
ncbi:MAG: tRNA 4-thiouridine(8) synthase ThiI [Planctomycetota bacterium]